MKPHYDNAYAPDNVYGHVIELLRRHLPVPEQEGIHLDLGCGYGRIAEALQGELSRHYLGIDLDLASVESLRARGLEAAVVDLNVSAAGIRQSIDAELKGRRVASITLIDVLEHVFLPGPLLETVQGLVQDHGAIFVMSVPNLAHRDVGFKLALGRYDMTTAGLPDHTHVQPFTAELLDDMLLRHGLHTFDRNDVRMVRSDQHFPAHHPALAPATVLSAFLRGLRGRTDDHATTNQLIVACLAGPKQPARYLRDEAARQDPVGRPLLSVVLRTQGRRPGALKDLLLALAAQTCDDFEVILVGQRLDRAHQVAVEEVLEPLDAALQQRLRFLRVDHGSRSDAFNLGFAEARGDYVTSFEDDEALPMAHWLETLREQAAAAPGCMLRSVAVRQDFDWQPVPGGPAAARAVSGPRPDYPVQHDLLEHLLDNRTPGIALAIPRTLYHDLGQRFDDQLDGGEDWEFAMRCAPLCGVHSSPEVTCIQRFWVDGEPAAGAPDAWRKTQQQVHDRIDALPLLLPAGASRQLRELRLECERLRAELAHQRSGAVPAAAPAEPNVQDALDAEQARHELRLVLGSWSWRVTAPLRWVRRLLA